MVLVVVLVALVGADIGARVWSEGQVESAARREAPEASAEADVEGFPFLFPLFARGRVDHVDLLMRDVGTAQLRFERLEFSLDGVRISRRALIRDREVELRDIDRGTITAVLPMGPLVQKMGRRLPTGGLTARIVARTLQLRAGPVALDVPLPEADLMPCEGRARVTPDRVTISCTITDLPPGLMEAVNQAR